jgi:hypothetical protein
VPLYTLHWSVQEQQSAQRGENPALCPIPTCNNERALATNDSLSYFSIG